MGQRCYPSPSIGLSATLSSATQTLRFLATVAKRTRGVGVRSPYRPGGGPPVRSSSAAPRPTMGRGAEPPAAIPGAPPRATEASDLVAGAIAATEATSRSTATTRVTAPPTTRAHRGRVKVKEGSLLAQRGQDEYVYVGQDLRRIAVVAGVLFTALIVLWLLFTIVDPFGIY